MLLKSIYELCFSTKNNRQYFTTSGLRLSAYYILRFIHYPITIYWLNFPMKLLFLPYQSSPLFYFFRYKFFHFSYLQKLSHLPLLQQLIFYCSIIPSFIDYLFLLLIIFWNSVYFIIHTADSILTQIIISSQHLNFPTILYSFIDVFSILSTN